MPKKTASVRGGASRNRPKPQKNIKLVHPDAAINENDLQSEGNEENMPLIVPASKTAVASAATVSKTELATSKKSEVESMPSQKEQVVTDLPAANKGSAAARLAARRQTPTVLKSPTARNSSLITSEHYAYVRRDLIYILILAIIMFSAIIILHFIPAIGG
jgi:hypothetical protein